MTVSLQDRQKAQSLIVSRLGLDFSNKRERDLERGLSKALSLSSFSSLDKYLDWLEAQPEESPAWMRLAGYLTVGETYFFRDQDCFEVLEHQVLPALIAARRAAGWMKLPAASCGVSQN